MQEMHFSILEIIFCVFMAENNFVKVLIQFIWVRYSDKRIDRLRGDVNLNGSMYCFIFIIYHLYFTINYETDI